MHRRPLSEAVCIDEVHVEVSKVCNYALVIQDFVTGEPIDMIANRRNEITEPYFTNLPTAEKNRVRYLVSDMYKPYIAYVEKYFPNAISVVDSFHVIKHINNQLRNYLRKLANTIRNRDLQQHIQREVHFNRELKFIPSDEYYLVKNFQWVILSNQDNLKYSAPARYNRKLGYYIDLPLLESLLFKIDPQLMERLCADGTHLSRLSNGPMESLNRIAKDLKRNARGFRNFEHLRNRFLFSERKNAQMLATPLSPEKYQVRTGIKRGKYKKKTSK